MGNPAVCLESSQSCWDCSWTGSSWLSFQPTVTHKQTSSWAPIIFENPTMETGCDQWGRCQRQCAWSQVYWSAEEYRQTFVSCIMSAGQMGFSLVWEGAEDGRFGGGRVGWRWLGGGGWRQRWEPQVCSVRRKRWQFAGPPGPWGEDQDLPWLPASQLTAAGWRATPAAPPTTTSAIKSLARLQAGAQ